MRVVLDGASGRIGRELARALPDRKALYRSNLDITDEAAVRSYPWGEFDVIVNAAGYTAVDEAETAAGQETAWAVNAHGPAYLAEAAHEHGLRLVHLSTDYVYSGNGREPQPVCTTPNPINVYGRTKAAGDAAVQGLREHYIVRTTWVQSGGQCFVSSMLDLARSGACPTIADDQFGRLTFADELAEGIVQLTCSEDPAPFGVYNLTGGGEPASWADIARRVFEAAGRRGQDVRGRSTSEYCAEFPQRARRPLNSVLDLEPARAVGVELGYWPERLERHLRSITR